MIRLQEFADAGTLHSALLAALAVQADAALSARGCALLGLAGGGTPIPLYRDLAGLGLDWPRVVMALVDERWVDAADPASNERALREALAPALARGARLLGMKNHAPSAADGLAACEDAYRALPLPFDALVLGMGEDGHFASLFPAAEGLREALDPGAPRLCAAIRAQPGSATARCEERISLTLAGIARSRAVELLFRGEAKREVFEHARSSGDPFHLPIRALLTLPGLSLRAWWAP